MLPGLLMIGLGALMFFFLLVQPSDVGLVNPDDKSTSGGKQHGQPDEELVPLTKDGRETHAHRAGDAKVTDAAAAIASSRAGARWGWAEGR